MIVYENSMEACHKFITLIVFMFQFKFWMELEAKKIITNEPIR